MIAQSLEEISRRIRLASQRACGDGREVTLLAVAKGQQAEKVAEAIQAGQKDFGENYAQEMVAHQNGIPPSGFPGFPDAPLNLRGALGGHGDPGGGIRWHFIGHLQRNKVKQIIGLVSLIHSIDSIDLAREIDKRAAAIDKVQAILIEVNLGREKSKTGIAPEEVPDLVRAIATLDHLDLKGLMTMPPPEEAPRPHFRKLREIRDTINTQNIYKHPLTELSMGMTGDFETAIEEGATIIRIGTGIFGERL